MSDILSKGEIELLREAERVGFSHQAVIILLYLHRLLDNSPEPKMFREVANAFADHHIGPGTR